MRDFLQADAVATLIGLPDGAAFLRRRDRLEGQAGFPPPLPTSLRPLLWHRARVEGWIAAQASGAQPPDPRRAPLPHNVHLLQAAGTR